MPSWRQISRAKLYCRRKHICLQPLILLNQKCKLYVALFILTIPSIIRIYVKNKAYSYDQTDKPEIVILHWNKYFAESHPEFVLSSDKCRSLKIGNILQPPISNVFSKPCRITNDHEYLNRSDAVIFHAYDLATRGPESLPKTARDPNQMFVWYTGETGNWPVNNADEYENIFNWTMSYRRDSDVYYPFGYIISTNTSKKWTTSANHGFRPSTLNSPFDRKSLKKKTRIAAGIVSHCTTNSKREKFVKNLQLYIPVDIFGKCGRYTCPLDRHDPEVLRKGFATCYNHIQFKYKFYLAFENALCLDYITEKFFIALQTQMVPVVYGGGMDGEREYLALAPKNSFIDARTFKSPRDLANYLIYLDRNDDEYLKYFEWKAEYQVIFKAYGPNGLGWCNLCQRLYDEQIRRKEKSPRLNDWYSHLSSWWNYKRVWNASAQFPPFKSQIKLPASLIRQDVELSEEKPTCVQRKDIFKFHRY